MPAPHHFTFKPLSSFVENPFVEVLLHGGPQRSLFLLTQQNSEGTTLKRELQFQSEGKMDQPLPSLWVCCTWSLLCDVAELGQLYSEGMPASWDLWKSSSTKDFSTKEGGS